MWKPFVSCDGDLHFELMQKKSYQFFLVRPKGFHQASGKKHVPLSVQLIDGKLYTPDNELDPVVYSHKNDVHVPSEDPFECDLEWHEIPD